MVSRKSVPQPDDSGLVLDIGRAYSGRDAAKLLGITEGTLNERVKEGELTPIFRTGDRRYSGYDLAKLLRWPLTDNPADYMPQATKSDVRVEPSFSRPTSSNRFRVYPR